MKKRNTLLLVLALLVFLGTSCANEGGNSVAGEQSQDTSEANTSDTDAEVGDASDGAPAAVLDLSEEIPVAALQEAYNENPSAYDGQEVTVTGWFSNISTTDDPPTVQFGLYPDKKCDFKTSAVHANFPGDAEEEMISIAQYSLITIKGTVEGGFFDQVNLIDCELVRIDD